MDFDAKCEQFIRYHADRRSGEGRRRLQEGLGHAEHLFLRNVWWPMFQHFDHLHPEYEIYDYKDGERHIDFAYLQPFFQLAIEIDGFGTHWRNITKWQFSNHCQRQNDLVIDGWHVLRFAYDDVQERPRLCQQTIQQLMGRFLHVSGALGNLTLIEREIVRTALRASRPIRPADLCEFLHISPKYARKLLHSLAERQWMEPAAGVSRIRAYQLHPTKRAIRF